jgi:hypothetical protein
MNVLELAILWGEIDGDDVWSTLSGHMEKNRSYTILGLHDADAAECRRAIEVTRQFADNRHSGCQFIDLGLLPSEAEKLGIPWEPIGEVPEDVARALRACVDTSLTLGDFELLVEHQRRYDLDDLSAEDLINWIHGRCIEIGIIKNRMLDRMEMQVQLAQYLIRLTRSHVEKRVSEEMAIDEAVMRLTADLGQELVRCHDVLFDSLLQSDSAKWKDMLDAFAADFVNNRLNRMDIREQFRL